ncbi:type IV secretory system conjugative DNA transfer family protein [[Mycoplasma] collis]|uniref:type IV secretory system conjugative DNA transfer family protein n=1 Tax=[Mycoplasma] collis TaxID=2127 RepID=UPI00051B8D62|nr:type IV secretory system conjugative DNA transfer family protein [[Mycoplasma] collis]
MNKKPIIIILFGMFFWFVSYLFVFLLFPLFDPSIEKSFLETLLKIHQHWNENLNIFLIHLLCFFISFIFTITFISIYLIFNRFFKNKNRYERNENGGASFLWDEVNKSGSFFKFNKIFYKKHNNQVPGWVVRYSKKFNKIKYYVATETHAKVLGSTGSGKTQRFIIPTAKYNINLKNFAKKPNLILIDPKGELYLELKNDLINNDYQTFVIDLHDPLTSLGFNFLSEVWDTFHNKNENEYTREANAFALLSEVINSLNNWTEEGENKIWSDGAKNVLNAIGKFFLYYSKTDSKFKKEHFNLSSFNQFLDDKNFKNGIWVNLVQNSDEAFFKDFWRLELASLVAITEKTLSGYLSQAQAVIKNYSSDLAIKSWSSRHDIDITKILNDSNDMTNKPFSIFIKFPDHKKDRHRYVSILIDQIYQAAIEIANNLPKQKLNRALLFFGDEFGNLPPLKDFDNKITISRSRNIFFSIVLQDLQQLSKYKDSRQIIENNTDLTIFLNSSDHQTLKNMSEIMGEKNIVRTSFSTNDKNTSSSSSQSLSEKRLVSVEELKNISKKHHFVIWSGIKPSRIKSKYAYKVWKNNKALPEKNEIITFEQEKHFFNFYNVAKPNVINPKDVQKNISNLIDEFDNEKIKPSLSKDKFKSQLNSIVNKKIKIKPNLEKNEKLEEIKELEEIEEDVNPRVQKELDFFYNKLKNLSISSDEYERVKKEIQNLLNQNKTKE